MPHSETTLIIVQRVYLQANVTIVHLQLPWPSTNAQIILNIAKVFVCKVQLQTHHIQVKFKINLL